MQHSTPLRGIDHAEVLNTAGLNWRLLGILDDGKAILKSIPGFCLSVLGFMMGKKVTGLMNNTKKNFVLE